MSPEGAQRIYLTFDDGPDPEWTPRIVDLLAATRTRATFFVIGKGAGRHTVLLRRLVSEGHEVGNHTWSHRHPLLLSARQARAEVARGSSVLQDLLGKQVRLFRPPHGRVRECMVDEAAKHGQQLVLWDLSAIDWGPLGRSSAIARRLQSTRAGQIVLMHDGPRGSDRARALTHVLPAYLRDLKHRNLTGTLLP